MSAFARDFFVAPFYVAVDVHAEMVERIQQRVNKHCGLLARNIIFGIRLAEPEVAVYLFHGGV